MTVPPVLSPFLRRASRWLAALLALGVAGFAAAAAVMFFWVLPNIGEHRDTVASLMSRALGQRVTFEAVSGVWQQARPEFRLQGVRLYDPEGRPALYLPELEASFAWRSLLLLEPRFNTIELQGLELDVRRARDGHFYVGGIPINPAAPESGFSSWVLRQGRVSITQATVTWVDEVAATPPLALTGVDFTLARRLRSHRLRLHAVPPPTLARPLTVEGELAGRDLDDFRTWSGNVDATVPGVSFAQLANWLALPYQPARGWGALRLKFAVARGTLAGVSLGIDLRDIETTLGAGLPPLRLAQVHGRGQWQRTGDGQRLAFDSLRVALPGGRLGAPFDGGFAWDRTAREITARAFELSGWQSLLPSLPMDAALRERLLALQPQGRLDEFRLHWRGAQPGIDNFSVAAHFSGLGIAASGRQPGLANLTGRVEGDAGAGVFEIDSTRLVVGLPELFHEPAFELDTLRARGSWKKTPRGRRLTLREARFANADLAGGARGHYELIAGHPGVIDLTAQLDRADGTAVYRYLPKKVGEKTVDWVRRGVVAGRSDNVQLNLRGDLANFPFEHGNGVFRVDARVKDGVIDYVPGWPRIEGVAGRLLFQGKSMDVTSSQARIYGVALDPVKVVIPDLIHHDEELLVDGEASGPARDFIRFANTSPVGERLRGVSRALEGEGTMRLKLQLRVPLRHAADTTLAGNLAFQGNSLFRAGLPRLEQVRGNVDFTGHTLAARGVTAQFLGGPLRVDTATRDGHVQVLAQGRATAAGIAPVLGAGWAGRLSGQAAWRGEIDLQPAGERIRVESDLVGLAFSLPAPLAKPAEQSLALRVTSQTQAGGQLHEVQLGRTVAALWRTANGRLDRGEVRFGGPATLPGEPGLRLAGNGSGLDVSGWAALLPADGDDDGALALSSIDLGFEAFDLMGRRYRDVRLQGGTRGGLLHTRISGRGMSGMLTYRPEGAQPARVSAQFRQLTIPPSEGTAAAAGGGSGRASEFPELDLTVEDFRLQDHVLGRLELAAHGAQQGLVIEKLQLTHADSVFAMSGQWRDTGLSETRADLQLKVLDAGKFLSRFGFADTLNHGAAEIRGNASWEGSPADFSVRTLAGQLNFKASGGQFLKIEAGVGKLLGVLSLQSVRRRLNFDFRDIFKEGFAFDDMDATLRIARGVVYSDDFRMRGPAAKVNMSGLADLNQETVQLRVKVIPKLSEGVAVAGALIAGPLAGVGALAAQKLLRDPVEEAISQEYMVTGSWLAPEVSKLAKGKAPDAEP
jgi:uncharacterized protein (TIGR02099 family)